MRVILVVQSFTDLIKKKNRRYYLHIFSFGLIYISANQTFLLWIEDCKYVRNLWQVNANHILNFVV